MMNSGLLRKPFETWCASDIVFSDLNDVIILGNHEAKRQGKNKIVISGDKKDNMNTFTHEPSIQKGADSIKKTCNNNNINHTAARKHIESIQGTNTPMLYI